MESDSVVSMQQVHGNNVVAVTKKDIGKTIKECDGLVTNSPDVILRISVADCLPIFFSSENVAGLVHAGWRGLDNKIIQKTVILLNQKLKVKSENVSVYIGPHICQKHYEVKAEVSDKFNVYPKSILKQKNKLYLDLEWVAKEQLISLGIKAENIKIDKDCTFENKKLKSYRRGDKSGRSVYLFGLNV